MQFSPTADRGNLSNDMKKLEFNPILQETHLFHSLHGPPLEEAEFTSRPSVMLVGQYSTGKTTLIRSELKILCSVKILNQLSMLSLDSDTFLEKILKDAELDQSQQQISRVNIICWVNTSWCRVKESFFYGNHL